MKTLLKIALSLLPLLSTACFPPADLDGEGQTVGRYSTERETRVLSFLNDQVSTTLRRLDVDCALRVDAAQGLILHRDGPDALPATSDDDLFDSIDEIDQVGGVGPTTLEKLMTCADWYAPADQPIADRVEVVTDLELLDPTLADLITGTLLEEASRLADPAIDAPVEFESVTLHSADGKVVRYEVDYRQGEKLIRIVLDAELAIVTADLP